MIGITCGKLSGLDSNITKSTPIGTVTWLNTNSSLNFVHLNTFPRMFVFDAICFKPSANVSNFLLLNDKRPSKEELKSVFFFKF
jgi:hypothetical protein